MKPIAVAIQGKGPLNMMRRAGVIGWRYGLTPRNMDRIMARLAGALSEYQCGATFCITGAALARHKGVVEKYQTHDMEFAIHGYYHVDHRQLSLDDQVRHFGMARRLFEERKLTCNGFRSPYLRWSEDTLAAIRHTGLLYDTSQVIAWDVVGADETSAYRRVLDFYGAIRASDYPALPRLDQGLVRIPYCVPDDEALIDRLVFKTESALSEPWRAILAETYRLGELFTLGLHPERITHCERPLRETLRAARKLSPGVWTGRLDQIARWWIDRTESTVTMSEGSDNELRVRVEGPDGTTILTRNVEVMVPTTDWDGIYRRVSAADFTLRANRRPFIGVSPASAPYLVSFLQQQGYIVEPAEDDQRHTFFVDRPRFGYEHERALLDDIESSAAPLVRLGRWPHGARSALCVTGDIDALTLWDYGLRFLGN